ncbi:MAG TPA: sulfite exporter TauE/SafE family protein [Pelomicrobium sp.]|nr:sulfite exporter TauE/SafE family protein [Pelomicrobium sp.]
MSDPVVMVAVVAGTFVLAGLVKGVIGLGLPTLAMALLGSVMPPAHAAGILIVPSLATNVWQMLAGPGLAGLARRLWTMMAAIAAGTWAGAGLLVAGDSGATRSLLGLSLIVYAGLGLAAVPMRVPPALERWLSPGAGAATGIVTGATGVFVIPSVPYLQALGLDRDELVQALGLSFTVSTLALMAVLTREGIFQTQAAAWSLFALLPAVGGVQLGQRLRARISAVVFRRCFFAGLAALGGHLLLSSAMR